MTPNERTAAILRKLERQPRKGASLSEVAAHNAERKVLAELAQLRVRIPAVGRRV